MAQKLKLSLTTALVVAFSLTSLPSAQATGNTPHDYTADATKVANYINANWTPSTTDALGPQLDALIALSSVKAVTGSGAYNTKINTMVNTTIPAAGMSYCDSGTYVNYGGCAKVAIALMASGKSPTDGAVTPYLNKVSGANTWNQYATNQALAIIALARAGRPIPVELYNVAIAHTTTNPTWQDRDTDGLMITALSYVNDPQSAPAINRLRTRIGSPTATSAAGWAPYDTAPNVGTPSVNTTAWVAPGFHRSGGLYRERAVWGQEWIASRLVDVNGDSSQKYADPAPGGDKMMASTQAVPALLNLRSYDNAGSGPAAQAVTIASATTAQMSIKAADKPNGGGHQPQVILNNVTGGALTVKLQGAGATGAGGYCWPTAAVPTTVLQTKAGSVSATGTPTVPSFSISSTGANKCHRWEVTWTKGSETLTRTSEPFKVG